MKDKQKQTLFPIQIPTMRWIPRHRCVVCAEGNTPIAKRMTALTLMFLSFHKEVSSSARAAYFFVLSGQIFVMVLPRAIPTSIRSNVVLALSSSITSALGSCFVTQSSWVSTYSFFCANFFFFLIQAHFQTKIGGFSTFLCL